jgi:hypothetical protein
MWDATNSGTFSVRYADGSFTASGSFSSAGQFGEMGTERNGSFVKDEEGQDDDAAEVDLSPSDQDQMSGTALNQAIPNLRYGTAESTPAQGEVPVAVAHALATFAAAHSLAHSAKEWATRDPRNLF